MTGIIVAISWGRSPEAGGIAEMADLPEFGSGRDRPARRGRQHHQGGDQGVRHRLGGTAALVFFASYTDVVNNKLSGAHLSLLSFNNVKAIGGLFLGRHLPFELLAMLAVGRAVVSFSRCAASSRRFPDHGGDRPAEYASGAALRPPPPSGR